MPDLGQIVSSPWLGASLAIIGIGVGLYSYWRNRNVVRVSYEIAETTIIGAPHAAFSKKLEIRFGGTPVPRVTASQVKIWNSGSVTLRKADVAATDPVVLTVGEGAVILQ